MLKDIIQERRKKLNNFIKAGIEPYPEKTNRTHKVSEALAGFSSLSKSRRKIFVCGRVFGMRVMGNIVFYDLRDESGKIQGVLKADALVGSPTSRRGKDTFKLFKENLDMGDFIEVGGILFTTKTGEKSVEIKSLRLLAKSLRPLPSQWHGLKEIEERYRKRYLDIFLNPDVKETINKRSEIIQTVRNDLLKAGFNEVETPMLQVLPGGALARPFTTHHNALNVDFYLRIAPELYLKRLLVAGYEKIFEIGRVFRNEGIDRDHNPEFTMLELYWAYQDWEGLMKFTEKLLKKFIGGVWSKMKYEEAIRKYVGRNLKDIKPEEIDEVFKKEARPKIIKPTFITHYPKLISPLAKACPDNPALTERFQLIADGMEIVNGFSELNDPNDQRARMEEQERRYRKGDKEASRLDEDFLEALDYGMPPAAGLGIGIDRLVSLITKKRNIKEVIIFPTLKPK
jgi:lysyl-tRNA synthetase class 2